jgi:hypothetical protein
VVTVATDLPVATDRPPRETITTPGARLMPRKSPLEFMPSQGSRPVLKPPADLDAVEREEFANLVLSVPPGDLLPCDVPLVAHLARNIVLARVAHGEMKASGFVSDRPSPWLAILQHASKEMRSALRMLSLVPSSYRIAPKPDDDLEVSYYTRMSMLEKRSDDEPNN